MNCPITAMPMKRGMAILGVSRQIRKGIINGIEACIISHHVNVIFRNFARCLPKKTLVTNEIADMIAILIQLIDYYRVYCTKVENVHISS